MVIDKKWLIKFLIMIVFPFFLSFYLFNPFVSYEIDNKMIKIIDFEEQTNKYTFIVGEFNETEVDNSLISSYFEEITNIRIGFKKYDLYFKDTSYIERPDIAKLSYNISVEGNNFLVKYGEEKKIIEDVDLRKNYLVSVSPEILVIHKRNITQLDFKLSYNWFIKKSIKEFMIKMFLVILVWNGIFISPVYFIYEKLFKGFLVDKNA